MLAVLTQNISFRDFSNNLITMRQGDPIYVDTNTMTAWAQDIAFSILPSEFQVYH